MRATNAKGDSDWSLASSEITVEVGAPDAPAKPTVTSANGINTISWTAPADNGSNITSYEIQYNQPVSDSYESSGKAYRVQLLFAGGK